MARRAERSRKAAEEGSSSESESESSVETIDFETDAEQMEARVTYRATMNAKSNKVVKGLLVAASGGLAFGFFSPLFNIGVNDHFEWLKPGTVKLSGWTANFYFALSFTFWAHVTGIARMKGSGTDCKSYVNDSSKRALAFATGVVCGLGNTLQFLGGMAAGFATCDVVQ